MNNVWHFLREFESKDLVKRYIKNRFGYYISTEKAIEINSAFKQGRSYFESTLNADITVKPLLQYYGIVSLSRGLILILKRESREDNMKPSHGLKFKNWNEVATKGKLEDLIIKTTNGTFNELILATNNKSYFRIDTNQINGKVDFFKQERFEFSLNELSFSFPDLKQSVESWLGYDIPTSLLIKKSNINDEKSLIEIHGKDYLDKLFPDELFKNKTITHNKNKTSIVYEGNGIPHLSQKWEEVFPVGSVYVIPIFKNYVFMNDISKMYAISFIFGTISRYYPTMWNNICSGIKNDSIMPFVVNSLEFLQRNFPQIVIDFIQSPYSFEVEK